MRLIEQQLKINHNEWIINRKENLIALQYLHVKEMPLLIKQ